MTDNAFERPPRALDDDRPLFSEDDVPMFEQIQRALPDDGLDDSVEAALREIPPDDKQIAGIKQNIAKLEADGLWATARFYTRLLEKRESQEG